MKTYKKLFSYVPERKGWGILAILCSALSVLATVYGYYLIYRFLDGVLVAEDLSLASSYALQTALFLTLGAIFYIISGACSHVLAFRLETNLRKRGIEGLANASFRFFDLHPSGVTRKTIDDNAAQTHQVVAHLIPDHTQAFLSPILVLALSFYISWRVGLVLLILILLAGLLLKGMMGEKEFMKIYQEALATLSAESVEYVRGMPVVKIFGARVASFKALYKAITDYSKYAYDYSQSCKRPYVLYQWLFFGLMALLIIPLAFSSVAFGDPRVLAVELLLILFFSGILFVSFMKIMWVSMYDFQANYAVDALENLYQDMQEDQLAFGDERTFDNYNIEFSHVDFAYKDKQVLSDLSFTLQEGRSYALVGSSGSGKSTIAKLISGFYAVDAGTIKIGGKPLDAYRQEALIQNIAFVFQNAKLFKQSIYDNVALARPGASREAVMTALHLAGCDVILDKFPGREETLIGSAGVYLSGGEKQRIAIARAILKDAQIIIMDEASAAIDPDNEHELQKAFKNLMQDKTVIMIAHRLSSIRAVDEILVLDHGEIVERGSDAELMGQDTRYKGLMSLYQSANEWRVGCESVL
ncbi:ABC transporter ATP-binding protein [Peptococcus niger]|uniref:ATP-binding cassette, subfamily B n=1 Tax=Peptococcus niger TaxID=2741 RepID=A0A1G6VPG9_PEPNI|nr:ABC transporter ATP-binding protein [Peptococcus niger]SDD55424.1 ATP-binding cassette, subfamily B [Peptococcus niger]